MRVLSKHIVCVQFIKIELFYHSLKAVSNWLFSKRHLFSNQINNFIDKILTLKDHDAVDKLQNL